MIFEVDFWADYGHFSHPATIYSSLTYPIPPKSAIMGFLGAVGGLDGVEEYSFLNRIKYAIKINRIGGKANFCFNGIKDALPSIKNHQQRIKQRKQFYRELLIEPSFKLFIDFSDSIEESKTIRENLKNHQSLYQPYMGINLCLANFSFIAEHKSTQIANSDYIEISSAIPLETPFEIEFNKNYSDIRMATTIENGRIFGGFRDLLVELSGKTILAKPQNYSQFGDHKVMMI